MHRETGRLAADHGSATLLLPVGLLLMIVLGAIAVDLARLQTARAELQHRADAAVNDAATAGLDVDRYRRGGGYRIDPARAGRIARAAALVGPTGGLDELEVEVAVTGDRRVTVSVSGRAALLFAPALPGGTRAVDLAATAVAEAAIR